MKTNQRAELLQFIEAFGDEYGPQYFADSLTMTQAREKHIEHLRQENEQLKKQLALMESSETVPLSCGGADEKRPGAKGKGFAGMVNIQGE